MKKMVKLVGRPIDVEPDGLQQLADQLNAIGNMPADHATAWRRAEVVVEAPSLRLAASLFNEWAKRRPVFLGIAMQAEPTDRPEDLRLTTRGTYPDESAMWLLYLYFFGNRDRRRLKRCPQCGRWFVDATRPHTMIRCSTACTDKWWSLDRRREAGHDVPGSTRKTKRRAKR